MTFIEKYLGSVFIFKDVEILPGFDLNVLGLDFGDLGLLPLLITLIFIL